MQSSTPRLMFVVVMMLGASARGDGLTPSQARDRMIVPEGFRVEVFASEPDIRQPVAGCFDERGRMWVIEYLQYPNPAGLVPVKVDQYLRTEYDRMPEPPPRGPRGADRIKILEDTDGDGRADTITTFAEGLNLASGLAVGYGGVFVGQAPYLLFYPDKNRDDRPDGDPEVLLSGFGLQDAHATVNSLTWGPDGWLYGAQGSTVTAKIRGIEFQQGIWRYHPISRRFELFAEGGGNTWGVDFDRKGNIYGSSNGGFVAFHMVQGGYSWKGFAKHGPLHNPRTYGYFDSIPFRGNKPGGHVTPGGIIYKGRQFPDTFDGAFLGANLLSNTVYWYNLKPRGSSFEMTLGGTLLDSKDPWFRPIDLLTGPDGSVFVVDWYDRRASHLDPRDTWDRSNGRIYKISHDKAEKISRFDLSAMKTDDLVALRTHPNDWWVETSRRVLTERHDRSPIGALQKFLEGDTDEGKALRDLGLLLACGGLEREEALIRLLSHRLAVVRTWAVRLLGDAVSPSSAAALAIKTLAEREEDVSVRMQIAASSRRWPPSEGLAIIGPILSRDVDFADPLIPLLCWWTYERGLREAPEQAISSFRDVTGNTRATHQIADTFVVERVARALSEEGTAPAFSLLASLVGEDATPDVVRSVVRGMNLGLQGRRGMIVAEDLRAKLEHSGTFRSDNLAQVELACRLGQPGAVDRAGNLLRNSSTSAEDRVALCRLFGDLGTPVAKQSLLDVVRSEKAPSVVSAALNALTGFVDDEIFREVISQVEKPDFVARNQAIDLLSGRPGSSAMLLEATESKRIDPRIITRNQAMKIASHRDPNLMTRLERVWGRLPIRDATSRTRRIAEIRGLLPEGDKGNEIRGRVVFNNQCAGCHRLFGEGERIGPELTGSERGDLDFLLTSLVDPSAVIRKEYEGQTLALKDGRVISGLVLEETTRSVTLHDSQRQKIVVDKSEIEERKAATSSLMPEGLLDTLSEVQVRDLFRYLQSAGPSAGK